MYRQFINIGKEMVYGDLEGRIEVVFFIYIFICFCYYRGDSGVLLGRWVYYIVFGRVYQIY